MADRADLQKAGLKVTLPRMAILKILEGSRRHMSAEEVYRQLLDQQQDIGLATVYRVLTQFEASGLVTRLRFSDDHSVFELTSDNHHDHLVCVRCSKVEEFVDPEIENRQAEIAKKLGYQITDHSLYLYGICPSCQKNLP